MRLAGRVALVTGAAGGIGAASATALAREGASVGVSDLDFDGATQVAKAITGAGGIATPLPLDVSDGDQWRAALTDLADAYGPVDVLHSNAALTTREALTNDLDVTTLDMDLFDQVISVNLRASVLGCKLVIPGMIEAGRGSIVITSSVKGLVGSAHRTAYSVAKGGLDALTRMVAAGYGKKGIRCNAIAPGIVMTAAVEAAVPPERLSALQAAHLTPTMGRPEDIAAAVVFLASDEAAFITGQVIAVDGGLIGHTAALSPPGARGE